MVTLIGIILLALGVSLAVVWQTSVVGVLMGIIPLALICWGVIVVLIGYAEMKARREYREAVSDSDVAPADSREDRANRGHNGRRQNAPISTTTPNANATPSGTPASTAPTPPNHSS